MEMGDEDFGEVLHPQAVEASSLGRRCLTNDPRSAVDDIRQVVDDYREAGTLMARVRVGGSGAEEDDLR
jgi:hypothetical protein